MKSCINYISEHLHDDMRLEELSRRCGLCSRSLSIKFKAEMGMGIPEYIHREKLREARYLLDYTDYTLCRNRRIFELSDPELLLPRFSKNTKACTPQQLPQQITWNAVRGSGI